MSERPAPLWQRTFRKSNASLFTEAARLRKEHPHGLWRAESRYGNWWHLCFVVNGEPVYTVFCMGEEAALYALRLLYEDAEIQPGPLDDGPKQG